MKINARHKHRKMTVDYIILASTASAAATTAATAAGPTLLAADAIR